MTANHPREVLPAALADILTKYSTAVLKDPTRLRNLLSDRCGQYRQEINVMVNALAHGALEHVGNAGDMPRAEAVAKLAAHLERELSIPGETAMWTSQTWFDAVKGTEARIFTAEMIANWYAYHHRTAKRRVFVATLTLAAAILAVMVVVQMLLVERWFGAGVSMNPFEPLIVALLSGLAIRNRWKNLTDARAVEVSARPAGLGFR